MGRTSPLTGILIMFSSLSVLTVFAFNALPFYIRGKNYGILKYIGMIVSLLFPITIVFASWKAFAFIMPASHISIFQKAIGVLAYILVGWILVLFIKEMRKNAKKEEENSIKVESCRYCHLEVKPITNKLNPFLHLPLVLLTFFTWLIGVCILYLKNQKTWKCPKCGKVNKVKEVGTE